MFLGENMAEDEEDKNKKKVGEEKPPQPMTPAFEETLRKTCDLLKGSGIENMARRKQIRDNSIAVSDAYRMNNGAQAPVDSYVKHDPQGVADKNFTVNLQTLMVELQLLPPSGITGKLDDVTINAVFSENGLNALIARYNQLHPDLSVPLGVLKQDNVTETLNSLALGTKYLESTGQGPQNNTGSSLKIDTKGALNILAQKLDRVIPGQTNLEITPDEIEAYAQGRELRRRMEAANTDGFAGLSREEVKAEGEAFKQAVALFGTTNDKGEVSISADQMQSAKAADEAFDQLLASNGFEKKAYTIQDFKKQALFELSPKNTDIVVKNDGKGQGIP
jgi:hypothetical protein